MQVAVIAHADKTLGGGLPELRQVLADAGFADPLWFEVPKSKKAPKMVKKALKKGADLIFAWGGDGLVQHTIDALAGSRVPLAILPAGTANLLATHFAIPKDIDEAVAIGLRGQRKKIDVGVMNGERFAVMAGTGFDAELMRRMDKKLKEQLGRLAYFKTGLKSMKLRRTRARVEVDGATWFEGNASCVLLGNIGRVTGGFDIFERASPSDGLLEVAVMTAKSRWQWLRIFSSIATGDRSPLVRYGRGKKVRIKLGRDMPFQIDGGDRERVRKLKAYVERGALTLCVPRRRR